MTREGIIHFRCVWQRKRNPSSFCGLGSLVKVRGRLMALGLLGVDPGGIGYGNLSVRARGGGFWITGSQTGGVRQSSPKIFTRVSGCEIAKNRVRCEGPVPASSETLTHAAVYEAWPLSRSVIHVHDRSVWKRLHGRWPGTSPRAAYGSVALAKEIRRLCRRPEVRRKKVLVMRGHPDGILVFGRSAREALHRLLEIHRRFPAFRG